MKKLALAVLATSLLSGTVYAQVNEGLSKPDTNLPFTLYAGDHASKFPWRIAPFCPVAACW